MYYLSQPAKVLLIRVRPSDYTKSHDIRQKGSVFDLEI